MALPQARFLLLLIVTIHASSCHFHASNYSIYFDSHFNLLLSRLIRIPAQITREREICVVLLRSQRVPLYGLCNMFQMAKVKHNSGSKCLPYTAKSCRQNVSINSRVFRAFWNNEITRRCNQVSLALIAKNAGRALLLWNDKMSKTFHVAVILTHSFHSNYCEQLRFSPHELQYL